VMNAGCSVELAVLSFSSIDGDSPGLVWAFFDVLEADSILRFGQSVVEAEWSMFELASEVVILPHHPQSQSSRRCAGVCDACGHVFGVSLYVLDRR